MLSAFLLTSLQTLPDNTGIPNGSNMNMVGKVRPNNYSALRDYRTLPFVADLPLEKKQKFTGTIITLDFPQRGMVHVMNYKDGKRVVLDNPKKVVKENGVPLTTLLSTLPPKIDIRYAGINGASFDVKLPGEEKKLIGFNGTLTSMSLKPGGKGLSIVVSNGKVKSSAWLKANGFRK